VPLSNAEKQQRHRDKLREDINLMVGYVTEVRAMCQQLLEEIGWLRNHHPSGYVTAPPPTQTLPEPLNPTDSLPLLSVSNETSSPPFSVAKAKPKTQLESEKARLARVDAWLPSEKHRTIALDEMHDDAWLEREAERYRDQQRNAKLKHRDFEAGFRNWIRNAPQYQPRGNGSGNGHAKRSAVDNLYLGAFEAAAELERRDAVERNRRQGSGSDGPLLDRQR
jgi:hypothetical protein